MLSVDYRKLRDGPFPAALLDAVSGYAYLLSIGVRPSSIIVGGDSAGGHLTLALTRYLRDELEHKELPKALLLFSPWCNMENEFGPRLHFNPSKNLKIDYLNLDAVSFPLPPDLCPN